MKVNTLILDVIEAITFPISFIGYAWHLLVESPFFLGRRRANMLLVNLAIKADEETENNE